MPNLAEILETDSSHFSEKLKEMGCIGGAIIRLSLKAPLGDPMAFELDGYTLSMRKKEADTIQVKLLRVNE